MGKHSQKVKNRLIRKMKSRKPDHSLLPSEELLKMAQTNIDTYEYEKAQTLCQEVLKRDADDIRALEVSANLCLELGNIDGAKRCLGRAITVVPDSGFTKYFSMGQLLGGKEGLQCYVKGIELLNICIKETQKENLNVSNVKKSKLRDSNLPQASISNESSSKVISNPLIRKLSNGYCSIAELYMSDLCDEEEAEKESETYSKKAIECDTSNPEAYQLYANFLLIKEKIEEAKENIKKSVSLWLPDYLKIDSGDAAAGSFDPIEVCPLTYSARLSCGRILIEVGEHKLAEEILETLLSEDDEDVYTWYLLGWNIFLSDDDSNKPTAKENLLKALEIHSRVPCEDEQIVEHVKELLEKLKDVVVEETPNVEDLEVELLDDGMDVDSK